MAVSARRRLLALSIKMTAGLRGRKWKRKTLENAAGISEKSVEVVIQREVSMRSGISR
jgi:hypothetical protein